jgi:hypothetical protein
VLRPQIRLVWERIYCHVICDLLYLDWQAGKRGRTAVSTGTGPGTVDEQDVATVTPSRDSVDNLNSTGTGTTMAGGPGATEPETTVPGTTANENIPATGTVVGAPVTGDSDGSSSPPLPSLENLNAQDRGNDLSFARQNIVN